MIPISLLASGEVGRVEHVVGNLEDVRRLEEMGIRCGQHVQMMQPGSPCIIRLGGSRICYRNADGVGVLVVPLAPTLPTMKSSSF